MTNINAFTEYFGERAKRLVTKLSVGKEFNHASQEVLQPSPHLQIECKALWDTGASRSMIDKNFASQLELNPLGLPVTIHTAGGDRQTNLYSVNIYLPNDVVFQRVKVVEGELARHRGDEGCELLIGMDLISKGDFAVTNFDGNTCMSFRFPPSGHIDFVRELGGDQQ